MEFEKLGTKQVETILSGEIKNWIIWGRKKDWLPVGFRCPTGYRYVQPLGDVYESSYRAPFCDELQAVEFERVIVWLPDKHRQAFVMYHLDRAATGRGVIKVKGRDRKAELLGVHKSRYHELVGQAHNMLLRKWRSVNEPD